jgi:hypothetical protein
MVGIFPSEEEAKRIKVMVMLASLFNNPEAERVWEEHYSYLTLDQKIARLERENGLT